MAVIFVLFALLSFVYGETQTPCEDLNNEVIDNGYVSCRRQSSNLRCTVHCIPGYIARPATVVTCHRQRSYSQSSYVFDGVWSHPVNDVKCEEPTSCPHVQNADFPLHGKAVCHSDHKGGKTCRKVCTYPYEADLDTERCGPDTDFFWTHVLRHNRTKMSPCITPKKCKPLKDREMPEHGNMECRYETWADTVICNLKCERGYIPKPQSKKYEFCGPTTAYIWSYIHRARNSSAVIVGCEQALLTTEITFSLNKSCDKLSSVELNQGAAEIREALQSLKSLHIEDQAIWSEHSWLTYCQDKVHVSSNEVSQTTSGSTTQSQDTKVRHNSTMPQLHNTTTPPNGIKAGCETHSSDTNAVGLHASDIKERANTTNTTEPNITNDDTKKNEVTKFNLAMVDPTDGTYRENISITTQLTYSFHLERKCVKGACEDICYLLNMTSDTPDSRCIQRCNDRATKSQVRQLVMSYTGQVMEDMSFDILEGVLSGAEVKLVNVTVSNIIDYRYQPAPVRRSRYDQYSQQDSC